MMNKNKKLMNKKGFLMDLIGMIVKPIVFVLVLLLIVFLIWKYVDIPGVIKYFLLKGMN